MNRRLKLAAVTAALSAASLVLLQCGNKPPCDATTCATGCCDASGTCQDGSSPVACGKGGATCNDCSVKNQACSAALRMCVGGGTGGGAGGGGGGTAGGQAGGSGGSGGAGGGSGGAGGGAQACLQFSMIRPLSTYGGYEDSSQAAPYDHYVLGEHLDPMVMNAPSGTTMLWLEIWSNGTSFPSLPAQRDFDETNKYSQCDVCLGVALGCNAQGGQCSKDLLSVGGSTTVTDYVQNAAAGRIAATGTTLKFREWNYSNDAPVPGGTCVELTGFTMNISWGAVPDAGIDGGSTTDGGTSDGGSSADGGETDAGATPDGGEGDGGSTDAGSDDAGFFDAG